MTALIRNELMKIFSKKTSFIYLIIIILATVAAGWIYQNMNKNNNENWREQLQQEISYQQETLRDENIPEEHKLQIKEQMEQNQQFLDENINPRAVNNWTYMNTVVTGITSLVTVFSVIICSANVSAEFSDGTIKQLLIRPHRRFKILLSKYLAVSLYSFMLVLTLLISGYVVGILLFGNSPFDAKIVEMTIEGQKEATVGQQFFLKTLYYLPSLLMISAIAFMLSTIFKNQALAVGIGLFVLFFSSTAGGLIILLAQKYAWAKFLIFPHLNLTIYALQDKILDNITLPYSLAVLGIYYAIFMALTFYYFEKRDIAF